MKDIFLLFSFVFTFSLGVVHTSSAKKPGYGFDCMPSARTARVRMNIYVDLLCPDCHEAFPVMNALADHYGPGILRLTTNMFPLPKHRNAFLAAKISFAVDVVTHGNLTYPLMGTIYDKMYEFSESATMHITEDEILKKFIILASDVTGVPGEAIYKEFNKADTRREVDRNWKYGCSRAVADVPAFFINDVMVDAQRSWKLDDWRAVIDPLIRE